jgi:hypothetical protein
VLPAKSAFDEIVATPSISSPLTQHGNVEKQDIFVVLAFSRQRRCIFLLCFDLVLALGGVVCLAHKEDV